MGTEPQNKPITMLLDAAAAGQAQASIELLPLVYEELRRLADSHLRRTPGHTLQATALVHEAYLRLIGKEALTWQSRGHFFFAAARAMRDILVEHARGKLSLKRGGGRAKLDIDQLQVALETPPEELIALDEALRRLEESDPQSHKLVMLRFFAGLTEVQAAEALGMSERTVRREWQYVRARLHRDLSKSRE